MLEAGGSPSINPAVGDWPYEQHRVAQRLAILRHTEGVVRRDVLVEKTMIGRLIGPGGSTYRKLLATTNCEIFVLDKEGPPPGFGFDQRLIVLMGTEAVVAHANVEINAIVEACKGKTSSPKSKGSPKAAWTPQQPPVGGYATQQPNFGWQPQISAYPMEQFGAYPSTAPAPWTQPLAVAPLGTPLQFAAAPELYSEPQVGWNPYYFGGQPPQKPLSPLLPPNALHPQLLATPPQTMQPPLPPRPPAGPPPAQPPLPPEPPPPSQS